MRRHFCYALPEKNINDRNALLQALSFSCFKSLRVKLMRLVRYREHLVFSNKLRMFLSWFYCQSEMDVPPFYD